MNSAKAKIRVIFFKTKKKKVKKEKGNREVVEELVKRKRPAVHANDKKNMLDVGI